MCEWNDLIVWHDSFVSDIWLIRFCKSSCSMKTASNIAAPCSVPFCFWFLIVIKVDSVTSFMCTWHDFSVWHNWVMSDVWLVWFFRNWCSTKTVFRILAPPHWATLCATTSSPLFNTSGVTCVCHDSFICVPWLLQMCDMTHSHVWHGSFTCVTWLIHMCYMAHSHVWHDSFTCETWFIHMCDMTHSYVRHDSFIRETWLIDMWDMAHSHVLHDSFLCETWLLHMWDMTHPHVLHGAFTCVLWLNHICDMWYDSLQQIVHSSALRL